MMEKYLSRLKSAVKIPEEDFRVTYYDNEDIYFEYRSKSSDTPNTCTFHNNLWRCTCEDYMFRGVTDDGSFICKHILKSILYLKNKYNIDEDESFQRKLE